MGKQSIFFKWSGATFNFVLASLILKQDFFILHGQFRIKFSSLNLALYAKSYILPLVQI